MVQEKRAGLQAFLDNTQSGTLHKSWNQHVPDNLRRKFSLSYEYPQDLSYVVQRQQGVILLVYVRQDVIDELGNVTFAGSATENKTGNIACIKVLA